MTIKGLQAALELPGPKGYDRVSRAIRDLKRARFIERTGRGTYRYVGEPEDLDYTRSQKRMVRIIRIRTKRREPFTARKLSELSESSLSWAKRYIRLLVKKGYLKNVGFERIGRSKVRAPVYLADDTRLNDAWPAMRRQKKTAEIDDALSRIREMAYQVARDCEANRESLVSVSNLLKSMSTEINSVLVEMG
jgi:hypothetical protein